MTPAVEADYIVHDCLFAIGQAIGRHKAVDADAVGWIRARYRDMFEHVMSHEGNSWAADRNRVTAVGRYLGQRALFHARDRAIVDVASMREAAFEVERGCQMNAAREAGLAPIEPVRSAVS